MRARPGSVFPGRDAGIAQLVEHHVANVDVASSILVSRSKHSLVIIAANVDVATARLPQRGCQIILVSRRRRQPNMDGITFVKKAKEMELYKFTPVCMLTTESDRTGMEAGKAVGVQGWIVKPFQTHILLNVISKLVV